VLIRTFQTYQQLIPMKHRRINVTPRKSHLDLFHHGYYPFNMDCTSLKLSENRYSYATWGYVASEKKPLPSARIHLIQDGIHGNIVNYGPSGGHEHESSIAEVLLEETTEIQSWLKNNSISDQPRPWLIFDRGYWKQSRFQELDTLGWGWSVPWKKRTLIGVQQELLTFPSPDNEPLEILIWASGTEIPWKRIIGKLEPSDDKCWDVLTCDSKLNLNSILYLQKNRWEIEVLFQWLKQNLPIKQPLGTSWLHFVTHCLLVIVLHLILVYFLLNLGITKWKQYISRLLEDLKYSDLTTQSYRPIL
jgi:hypothetical protein